MKKYVNYRYTKEELIAFINGNAGLSNVEVDTQDKYTDINIEIFPSAKSITFCRVETSRDRRAQRRANEIASKLNDYFDEHEKIRK